jgi:NADH-quinone oxidoreductase subunit J
MSSLLTVEGLAGIVFWVLIGATVVGAMIATNAKRLIRAVSGLALCFIGVAGLYYFLNSPFLAAMQMLIYVGAVCVTIVFAVMLADPNNEDESGKRSPITGYLGFVVGLLLFLGLGVLGRKTSWFAASERINDGNIAAIGNALLTKYSMVFELISVVLLLAIIGSLVLARAGRDKA